MRHGNRLTWPLAAFLALGLAIISLSAACTKNQRLSTIRASVISVNTVRDEFAAWEIAHLRRLLAASTSREEILAEVAEYDAKSRVIWAGLALAYEALVLAAVAADDASLAAAMAAIKDLHESITDLKKAQAPTPGPSP